MYLSRYQPQRGEFAGEGANPVDFRTGGESSDCRRRDHNAAQTLDPPSPTGGAVDVAGHRMWVWLHRIALLLGSDRPPVAFAFSSRKWLFAI